MSRHALTQGGAVRSLAVAAALMTLAATAPPAGASDHNARVAEYLLLQHRDAGQRNARVAEYLLQHGDSGH